MSCARVTVIYGVPLTEDCIELIHKWEEDITSDKWTEDNEGACGFSDLYTAGGPRAGYCGVELSELAPYANQPVREVRMLPTPEEYIKAKERVDALDPELRERTGEMGVYFIWSDS